MTVTTFGLADLAGADRSAAQLRRELRDQIAHLDAEFAKANARLHRPVEADRHAGAPRMLSAAELESVRDTLVTRVISAQAGLAELHREETRQGERRALLRRMHDDPARHRWMTITTRDIGEPGCRRWESRPILGVIGVLSGWWRVRVSSGCP